MVFSPASVTLELNTSANSDLIVQLHYHPSGKPETDRTKIGLHFARKPIKQALHWSACRNYDLQLPADESNIEVKAEWPVPIDVEALAVALHMHLLGRDIAMSVKYPDGRVEDLVKIPQWDFNWQNTYWFETPLDLPKGTVVRVVAHYDNSASNPRNPNRPAKLVKWGEATTDEMCIGFIAIVQKGQDLTQPGQKDDLREILNRQREERDKKVKDAREAKERERAAAAKAKPDTAS